jgi:intracellular multiplication protein IcmL
MKNSEAAIMRRLTDPDFQAALVNRSLVLVLGMAGILAASLVHDAWVWTHPPAPIYFRVDGTHAPVQLTPLDSPIIDDTQLLDWTVRSVLVAYNVNYHDYPTQLNTASRHFTPHGWNTFAGSYIATGNLDELKRAMLLCYADSQRAAIITGSREVNGVLHYDIEFPIIQTCQNTQMQTTQNLVMKVVVVRINDLDHVDGVAIDQLVAVAR